MLAFLRAQMHCAGAAVCSGAAVALCSGLGAYCKNASPYSVQKNEEKK
jgi:hypothetical protein